MNTQSLPRWQIITLLFALSVSAFFYRLHNFSQEHRFTIDEEVYYVLGRGLLEHPGQYHIQEYARELQDIKPFPLPRYFWEPLFKHPPLFPGLIALSMSIFGSTFYSAAFVSIFFGVLFIPLGYLIGRDLFGKTAGVLTAIFLWIDPLNILCSQKIWMETTLSFLTGVSIYFYMRGLKGHPRNFLAGGVFTGLAALTKYPGGLVLPFIFTFFAIYERHKFQTKEFRWSMAIPLLMLCPWFGWNIAVYGPDFFTRHAALHSFPLHSVRTMLLTLFIMSLLALAAVSFRREAGRLSRDLPLPSFWLKFYRTGVSLILVLLAGTGLIANVTLTAVPATGWESKIFLGQTIFFYLRHLTEYSLLYFAGFLALIRLKDPERTVRLVKFFVLFYLLFFSVWRSYQSRYILNIILFLAPLGWAVMISCWQRLRKVPNRVFKTVGMTALLVMTAQIFIRAVILNLALCLHPDFAYF